MQEEATDREAERRRELELQHRAARLIELRRQARRSLGENIEDGARLSLAATTLAASFARTSS